MSALRSRVLLSLVTAGLVAALSACGTDGAARSGDPESAASEAKSSAPMATPGEASAGAGMGGMQSLGSESWQGMRVELASSPPTTFELFQGLQTREVKPEPEDSMHLMAVLSDAATQERIPYADCWVTVTDTDGRVVFDERMWPMISRDMGTHYGVNVPLPGPGEYSVELRVGPPQAARHPEYSDVWKKARTFTFPLRFEG